MTSIKPARGRRRANMRRAVILFPSGLTLGNLFFGIFAIITASRGNFRMAGVWVLWGGICDALDGRVARATNAGSQFGEELDSLVDAVSFGLAPAMIMYFAVLNRDGWDWIFVFLFAACAVMRLARFNIEQAGTAKTYFQGLPSPAAGITLASYYWFSQSWLYSYGAIGNLPWQELLRFLMAALGFLMISNVPYPVFPRTGFRSLRALGGLVLVVGSLVLLATKKFEYFFPITLIYVAWGLVRWVFSGLFERRQPTIPYDLSEGEDDEDDELDFEPGSSQVHATRQGHREPRGHRDDKARAPRVESAAPSRDERPARGRGEKPERPDRAEKPERGEKGEKGPRPPRSDEERAARPQRTEEERAALRERRDKRRERQKQRDADRATAAAAASGQVAPAAAAATGVSAITLGEPSLTDDEMPPELVGSIPGGAPLAEGAEGTSAGAPRKRKRRRRRGGKDRGNAAGGQAADGFSGGDDQGDGGDSGDDGDYADDVPQSPIERPFASATQPSSSPAPTFTQVPPAPAPTPAPAPSHAPAEPFTPPPAPAPASPTPAPASPPFTPPSDSNE